MIGTVNPFAERAKALRAAYDRINVPTSHDAAMAEHFPLGVGFGRKGRDKRREASLNRAVQAVAALKKAEAAEAKARAWDEGRIDDKGRAVKDLAVKAPKKPSLPIRNDPSAPVHMTSAEWSRVGKDYKSLLEGDDSRERFVIRDNALQPVYLTDKAVKP